MNDPDLNNFERKLVPPEFYLGQNYPNPFSEKTTIKYCVAYKTRVQLTVYDYDGKVIEKIVDEEKNPGTYEVEFSTCHSRESGNPLNGYYYYKMIAGDFTSEKKWLCINKLSGRLNMKALLQTLFFFFLVTQICFAQWFLQNPLPQGNDLNDVDFIDEFNGIAVGKSGTIIHTTDGGINWTTQESGTSNNLNGVCFTDASTGYAVGELGIILKTQDGGITWALQQYDQEYDLTDVCFVDANTGWIVNGWLSITDTTNIILHTTDGGINWVQQTYSLLWGEGLLSVYFLDANIGYAAGYYGSVFKTTDGGENWQFKLGMTGSTVITDIHFIDVNKGWVVQHRQDLPFVNNDGSAGFSEEGQILHTIDGGNTWTVQMNTLDADLFGIEFLDSSFGFAVGSTPARIPCSAVYSGIILRTKDGGTSWTIIDVPINTGWNSGFKDFCFTNEGNGVLVGNYGVILKSSNDGEIWDLKLYGTTNDLSGIEFTDINNGFAVGAGGTILRTTDSGTNWINQSSGTSLHLNDVCFADENNGWIVGVNKFDNNWGPTDSSIILHTTDGGISWLQQTTFVGTMQLFDLFFTDTNNGWAVGAEYSGDGDGVILRTTDGGINWETSLIQPITWFHSVYFIDSNTGWAVGHEQTILKTTNGGTNWIIQTAPAYGVHHTVYFIDENNGWVNGGTYILHTNNGGNNWNVQIPYNSTNSFSSVKFLDANNGWILSNDFSDQNSRMLKTSNGGTTWYPMYVGSHRWLNEFYFKDLNYGWIVGENGTILHTTNGGVSFVEEEQINEVPTEFLLSQNYPNPFNPQTSIQYAINSRQFVTLKVYDVLGNEIETLVNEEKSAGGYEITWYAEELPSGVYFYQLKAGSYVDTKKMLLLK